MQYRLVRCLSRRTGSITVVGDEDQSIYQLARRRHPQHPRLRARPPRRARRQAGAELPLDRQHPARRQRHHREEHRAAAQAPLHRGGRRRPASCVFEGETERDEAEFVAARIEEALSTTLAPRDFAVFYRTNAQSRVLEDALRARDIPYVGRGRHALLRPRRDQGPHRLPARHRQPRRRAGAAADRQRPGARHRRRHRRQGRRPRLRAARSRPGRRCELWRPPTRALLGAGPAQEGGGLRRAHARSCAPRAPASGPPSLAEKVLEESGYRDALAGEATLEAEGRIENLLELVAQMREYEREAEEPTLHGFLERVALASDVDGYDPEKGAVSLMTVHTAKGLEFPVVFITGLEERIFPHARSVDDDSAVEEERRLCYVAVTRARTLLHLSRVRRRRLSGQELPGIPSRFLRELPAGGRRADRHGAPARVRRLRRRARGAARGAAAGAATRTRAQASRGATSSPSSRRDVRERPRRVRPPRARPPSPARSSSSTTPTPRRARGCRSAPSCATPRSASARCAAGRAPAPISRSRCVSRAPA